MSTEVKEPINQDVEKKSKKPLIIVLGIVIGIAIAILSVFLISSSNKQNEYYNAVEMYNEKQFEQAIVVFSELNTYKDSQQYLEKCYIGSGDKLLEEKNYENARTEYNKINDSNLKTEMLMKCDYSEAEQMFQDKKYKEALSVFEALGTYSESAAYVEKCKIEIKYSKFDFSGNASDYQGFYSFYGGGDKTDNTDDAEEKLSFLYGSWYDENDNIIEITPPLFNGKEYGVCAIGDKNALLYFYDDENSIFRITRFEDEILGERIVCYASATSMKSIDGYMSVTSAEYNEAYAKWQAEQQAKKPNYSDNEIIELATSETKQKLRALYSAIGYSGAEMIYHVCQVNSSSVSYDWTTRTYTCYLNVSYSTSIFDILGTSTAYYNVTATYEDNGVRLVSTGYSIY